MSSEQHGTGFADLGDQQSWKPPEEQEKDAREHQAELHQETDHGRHNVDRSRPETIVRKNR